MGRSCRHMYMWGQGYEPMAERVLLCFYTEGKKRELNQSTDLNFFNIHIWF